MCGSSKSNDNIHHDTTSCIHYHLQLKKQFAAQQQQQQQHKQNLQTEHAIVRKNKRELQVGKLPLWLGVRHSMYIRSHL